MNTVLRLSAILLAALLLTACGGGEPTLDTSSDEALETSYAQITDGMSDQRRDEFDEALGTVYMLGALQHMNSGMSETEIMEKMNEDVHGKSADEIIAMAKDAEEEVLKRMGEMH